MAARITAWKRSGAQPRRRCSGGPSSASEVTIQPAVAGAQKAASEAPAAAELAAQQAYQAPSMWLFSGACPTSPHIVHKSNYIRLRNNTPRSALCAGALPGLLLLFLRAHAMPKPSAEAIASCRPAAVHGSSRARCRHEQARNCSTPPARLAQLEPMAMQSPIHTGPATCHAEDVGILGQHQLVEAGMRLHGDVWGRQAEARAGWEPSRQAGRSRHTWGNRWVAWSARTMASRRGSAENPPKGSEGRDVQKRSSARRCASLMCASSIQNHFRACREPQHQQRAGAALRCSPGQQTGCPSALPADQGSQSAPEAPPRLHPPPCCPAPQRQPRATQASQHSACAGATPPPTRCRRPRRCRRSGPHTRTCASGKAAV